MDLIQQFAANWADRFKFASGKKLLLAVSGGADSMVMATLFFKAGIPFEVAHCNYQLRGQESDKDEELVAGWCRDNAVPHHVRRFDTKAAKAEWKKGTQETARILRYEWFGQLKEELGCCRIATAHHAGDNVETLLINLMKGTGISGIHGILPDNGEVIRPLLFATKQQLLDFALQNQIAYREDASNASDDYLRNNIRHNVIPAMEMAQPGAAAHIAGSIERFREAEALYRRAVNKEVQRLMEQRGKDYYIPLRKLLLSAPLTTLVYELVTPFGFTPAQVPHILRLTDAESGHYISSSTHRILKDRDFLIITALPAEHADLAVIEAVPCTVTKGGYVYTFTLQSVPEKLDVTPDVALVDADNIQFPLYLRKWKTGDYLYPLGMNMKKKKVSRLLINNKIPLHLKELVEVVECGRKIVWVAGMRIDERFKVTAKTSRVLMIERKVL